MSIAREPTPLLATPEELSTYRAALSRSPLGRGLDPAALDDLLASVSVRGRGRGALLVSQDEPGDALFVVVRGRARVVLFGESGREMTLALLGPGDLFGELALVDGSPRSANVVALEDATLLQLGREPFLRFVARHPQAAVNLLGELAARLRHADRVIGNLALHDVASRVSRTLASLAQRDGGPVEGGGLLLRRRPTQQELANMVGSCRETVSRTLSAMVRRGLIERRGRGLVLRRPLLETLGEAPATARAA